MTRGGQGTIEGAGEQAAGETRLGRPPDYFTCENLHFARLHSPRKKSLQIVSLGFV